MNRASTKTDFKTLFRPIVFSGVCAAALVSTALASGPVEPAKPNVIFILGDDIGYGDFSCYGAQKIHTTNIDRIAREGRLFRDAYCPSATCTPTRYSLLTGEYAWRKAGTAILSADDALIIEPGRLTLPGVMKRAGYATGIIGKWHLGLGSQKPTNYNGEIKPGPREIGFDYAWFFPATGDRAPCVWIENHRVVGLDPKDPITVDATVRRGDPASYINGIPRIGSQKGGAAAMRKDQETADILVEKATHFIEDHKGGPFFLYLATHDIHVPRVPHPRFRGTSEAGVRGDTVESFDWTVGQVASALDRLGLAENTLLVITSDNGGSLSPNGPDVINAGTEETNNGHAFNGVLRGGKGSSYEGGVRVPLIVRWPAKVKPGVSSELISLMDMLGTMAELTGQKLGEHEGVDSFNVLPSLLGLSAKPCRNSLVLDGITDVASLREGHWKFIPAVAGAKPGGDGWNATQPVAQLYDLNEDLSEAHNLAGANPERVKSMGLLLNRIREGKASRP